MSAPGSGFPLFQTVVAAFLLLAAAGLAAVAVPALRRRPAVLVGWGVVTAALCVAVLANLVRILGELS